MRTYLLINSVCFIVEKLIEMKDGAHFEYGLARPIRWCMFGELGREVAAADDGIQTNDAAPCLAMKPSKRRPKQADILGWDILERLEIVHIGQWDIEVKPPRQRKYHANADGL